MTPNLPVIFAVSALVSAVLYLAALLFDIRYRPRVSSACRRIFQRLMLAVGIIGAAGLIIGGIAVVLIGAYWSPPLTEGDMQLLAWAPYCLFLPWAYYGLTTGLATTSSPTGS